MKDKGGLHILDALENLNTLVDAHSLDEIEVTDDLLLIPHKEEAEEEKHEIYWVKAGPDEQTLGAIKDTYLSVHAYLQTFYTKMKQSGDTKRLIEGINTIMVLVGEATKNFEKFGTLFNQKISDFEEYKELQDFYKNRVIRESFREFARTPLQGKPKEEISDSPEQASIQEKESLGREEVEEIAGVHIMNDLELIKKDHHYELFFLKNEAGHHFYTHALARSIKLACDFGEFAKEYFGDDPLLQIKNWEDKTLHTLAGSLLKTCRLPIEKFYQEAMKYKEMEVVTTVHNAIMSLMLAANPRNLIRQFALKGSHLYFQDFLLFLRQALNNREYQKFLIYSIPQSKPFFQDLLDLVHALCYHLFTSSAFNNELKLAMKHIIERFDNEETNKLSEVLVKANKGLTEALKQHPNGPVFKTVDVIRDPVEHIFDPLHQGNIPSKEWSIHINEAHTIEVIRMPSVIVQEAINKAYIIQEFKTFLGSIGAKQNLVLFNYQDRTSWKEHARSIALEELARQAEFADALHVITLAKDTDFYSQKELYQNVNEAEVFKGHFLQHLNDEITGYYFPLKLKKLLFPQFVHDLLNQIHATFFMKKAQLTQKERLDFIQLAYHFIELKVLELIKPAYTAFSSKDGLDIAGVTSLGLIALMTQDKDKIWKEAEYDQLITILFGPTLMNRERVIHPERFERLVSMIQRLENQGKYLNEFAELYDHNTLKWDITL